MNRFGSTLQELMAARMGGSEQAQQEAKQREDEMRNSILSQVLSQAARARLNNLALLSEQGLIEILEKVSQQTEKKTTVKFNRRKVMDSDEEDDD
ncbi:unnamed protein product [Ranitomeya imitator]|uniref:Programmed cell death 5 n=1 Tax=Ranitomeya imitator TaxID=111125 RepID=A0ABN9LD90_9NEOB|nr:unnamed protein product [Ranitomeya imitator]